MGIKHWIKAVSAAAIVSLAFGGAASAEHVVAPDSCGAGPCETTEGNWGNNQPFGVYLSATSYIEYQQVYASSDFAAIGTPMSITQIAFRPNTSPLPPGYAFDSINLPDVTIELSTTSKEPGALSTTLVEDSLAENENVGPDRMLVHSGPLVLSSDYAGSPAGPKDFDIVINLQAPFLYDPAAGNLLLFVKKIGGGFIPAFDAQQFSDTTSRLYYNPALSDPFKFVTTPANSGLVTRFTVTPVPSEPEPAPGPEPPPPPSDGQVSAAARPAKINPKSKGTTPVAIFGTASFDAGTVDPNTVTLNGAPVKTKPNGEPMASLEDVDGDGIRDLLVHVDTQDLVASATGTVAAASASSTMEVVLEGKTFDGTPIQGTFTLQVVK